MTFARLQRSFLFFFNDTATTEIYTLSLHDALPIWPDFRRHAPAPTGTEIHDHAFFLRDHRWHEVADDVLHAADVRSEEHTSELQSPCNLVCRLLLEKKKKIIPLY